MSMQPIDITNISCEAKDAEIFSTPATKTRLDTLQNYFFPRLEGLLHNTVVSSRKSTASMPMTG